MSDLQLNVDLKFTISNSLFWIWFDLIWKYFKPVGRGLKSNYETDQDFDGSSCEKKEEVR